MEKKNMCVLYYRSNQTHYRIACACGHEIDAYVYLENECAEAQENSYLFDRSRKKHFFRIVSKKLQIFLNHLKALYVQYVCSKYRDECHLHVFNDG